MTTTDERPASSSGTAKPGRRAELSRWWNARSRPQQWGLLVPVAAIIYLLPVLNPLLVQKYGLQLGSFIVENVSVPPEVEQAIDKRSSMAAIGNLNDYVKLKMAEGIGKGDGGGFAGQAAQLAMGFAMANQLASQTGGILGQNTPPSAPPPLPTSTAGAPPATAPAPELLSPADAARILGVGESDIIAALTDGSLKGKRIGTQWRITRAAIDDFLKS